jgi:hypothetical protein
MITATCKNTECQWHNVERTVGGEPARVQCGHCATDCDLTDLRPDPPEPDITELEEPA